MRDAAESVRTLANQERAPLSIEAGAKAVLALAALATLSLIWGHDTPPLVDWPNHMARHTLEALWLSGAPLPPGYTIAYGLMPNLGSDLIVPPLLLVFDTLTASKIFLSLAVGLYWAGPAAYVLQYQHRSASAWAVCALFAPWVMAGTFFWGFMNYYSGVGLAFLAAANHIRMAQAVERGARVPLWQYVAHAALLVLCYLWHLTSFGIYLVLAGCFMIERLLRAGWPRNWRAVLGETPFILAMLPALALMITVILTPKLNALSGGTVWSTPLRKLVLAFGYFGAYDLTIDVPLMAAWALAIVLVLRLTWRRLAFDHVMLAAVAFALLYLALPVEVGTTSGADIRMLPPLYLTVAALLARFELARTAALGLGLVAALIAARTTALHHRWSLMENDTRTLTAYLAKVPAHPKIVVLTFDRASKTDFQSHLIGWAVPANGAYVSSLFSYAGQQPLSLQRQASEATLKVVDDKLTFDAQALARDFDYAWVFDPAKAKGTSQAEIPADWKPVVTAGAGTLFRLR